MLVRIARDQVRIGMFVDRIEGAWMDHPFWARRFLVGDFADVEKLKDSGVAAIVIDVAKGVGLAAQPLENPFEPSLEPVDCDAFVTGGKPDLQRIERALGQLKQRVHALFAGARDGDPIDVAQASVLVGEIADAMRRNPALLVQITRLKAKDEGLFVHSIAVCALLTQFARYLRMDDARTAALGLGGLLHDIGKVALPAELLNKADRLTDAETRLVRTYPAEGHAFLSKQPDLPPVVRAICLGHRERIDGRGYPSGLQGEAIGPEVRMASICDVYDALTSANAARATWSSSQALQHMLERTGQFDRLLLLQFAASLGMRLSCAAPVRRSAAG